MDQPAPSTCSGAPDSRGASGDAAYVILRPTVQTTPVVFASPHSGRDYRPEFLAMSRLDPMALRRSEDSFVDQLLAAAPRLGMPLLLAQFPRAWCDPNREAWELDPDMFADPLPGWVITRSPRLDAGLGTLARVVASGEAIYRRKLRFAEAEQRVQSCWRPYHTALARLLDETLATFGGALLLDCHSMPSGRNLPDIVLGDAHGAACGLRIMQRIDQIFTSLGYQVRRNVPYAGGFVTQHYGRPQRRVHAIQIEIARGLYMDERRFEPLPGFRQLQQDLGLLAQALNREAAEWLR